MVWQSFAEKAVCEGRASSGRSGSGVFRNHQEASVATTEYGRGKRGGRKSEQCRASLYMVLETLVRTWGFPWGEIRSLWWRGQEGEWHEPTDVGEDNSDFFFENSPGWADGAGVW